MQELGATAVVAEGAESGGHIGDIHTMALVPQVVDALDIPVLAAGGIFDGRGRCRIHARRAGSTGLRQDSSSPTSATYTEKSMAARLIRRIRCQHHGDRKITWRRCARSKTPFTKKFFKMEYDPAVPKEEVLYPEPIHAQGRVRR